MLVSDRAYISIVVFTMVDSIGELKTRKLLKMLGSSVKSSKYNAGPTTFLGASCRILG